jgi:O-antigen ligase
MWLGRPQIAPARDTRLLDAALMVSGLALLVQLIPMPASLLRVVDPNATVLRATWLFTLQSNLDAMTLPITIAPAHTLAALVVFAATVALYWTCRRICEDGGAGRIIRAIAVIGLIASVVAIIQRAQSTRLLYGIWSPLDPGARPYGPFVNRNHFATWLVMACPVVFGYVLARAPSGRAQQFSVRLANALRQLGSIRIWLVASVCVMTLATLVSASRSGVLSLIAALAASVWLSTMKRTPGVLRWASLQALVMVIVVISFANFDALSARLDETLATAGAGRGRQAIWADTYRLIQDFKLTGTGAGTFALAINAYQTAAPGFSIGQAHNHYLQLAAEGGALVAVPIALASIAFAVVFVRRMSEERSSNYLMRAGAGAGIVGIIMQSFWETGIRMPANATMLAVLGAIATHGLVRTDALASRPTVERAE